MTAHWIDPETFERRSYAVACQRIRSSHTAQVLATRIFEIIERNGMAGKVSTIITDGGSNFVSAFKINILNEETFEPAENEENVKALESSEEEEKQESDLDDQVVHSSFEPVTLSGMVYADSENCVRSPPRTECAAHIINLIMTSDLKKSPMTESYNNLYDPISDKLKEVWKRQNMSGRISDMIHHKLGRYFITPVSTRWNSLLDSFEFFKTMMETKPNEVRYILDSLGIPQLTDIEIAFLDEIVSVISSCIVRHNHSFESTSGIETGR